MRTLADVVDRENLSRFDAAIRQWAKSDGRVAEIYRCQEIVRQYRNDPDQEVKDYCTSQSDRAETLIGELERGIASVRRLPVSSCRLAVVG